MESDNACYLTGNLTRDPELKTSKGGIPYCNFTVTTNRKDANGNDKADFIPIKVWGVLAEECGNNLSKGRRVTVRGRFTTSSWEDQGGQKRYFTQILANMVAIVLPSSRKTENGSGYGGNGYNGNGYGSGYNNGGYGGSNTSGGTQSQWNHSQNAQQNAQQGRGDFSQFGPSTPEPQPMEQTTFANYGQQPASSGPPDNVMGPKDEEIPF